MTAELESPKPLEFYLGSQRVPALGKPVRTVEFGSRGPILRTYRHAAEAEGRQRYVPVAELESAA